MAKSNDGKPDAAEAATPGLDRQSAADVAFVDALAKLLRQHDLSEIEVERESGDDNELKIRLTRQGGAAPILTAAGAAAALPAALAPHLIDAAPAESAAPAPSEDPSRNPNCVTSPMVGTVYLQAEPTSPAFVKIGDQVTAGQTLLIIEAMKTMNQIPSPRAGVVKAIYVENEQPIEFGAPLMVIE